MSELTERQKIEKMLSGEARYLRIDRFQKTPRGRFAEGCKNNLSDPPKTGNYGVIPSGKIVILDIDTHRANPDEIVEFLEKQKEIFQKFFAVDFSKTFTVKTPSGGLHVYLRLPMEAKELKNVPGMFKTSLRCVAAEICSTVDIHRIVIDADFRSGMSHGYVLGPSSAFGRKSRYEHNGVFSISEVPSEGFSNMMKAAKLRFQKVSSKAYDKEAKDQERSDEQDLGQKLYDDSIFPRGDYEVSQKIINSLKASIVNRGASSDFHSKRAFVKSALHCCLNDIAIADICEKLDLGIDSYTGRVLTRDELVQDIEKFVPYMRSHGKYCPNNLDPSKDSSSFEKSKELKPLDKNAAYLNRLSGGGKSTPRVLDLEIAFSLISKVGSNRLTQSKRDALNLFWKWFQPLANVGATSFMVSRREVSKALDITPQRLARALQLLRVADVIYVVGKPAPGRTSFWAINPRVENIEMTDFLLKTHGKYNLKNENEKSIVFEPNSSSFMGLFSGEIIYSNGIIEDWARNQLSISFEGFSPRHIDVSHTKKYCRRERETLSSDISTT